MPPLSLPLFSVTGIALRISSECPNSDPRWPSGFLSFALLMVLSVPSVKRTPTAALGQMLLIPLRVLHKNHTKAQRAGLYLRKVIILEFIHFSDSQQPVAWKGVILS